MQTLVRLQRIRIAPRKMRMVVDLVRGKNIAVAKNVLRFSKTRGAKILSKLLDSAVAAAKQLGQGDEASLTVLKIAVDEGPKLKRWRARAKGSAYPIQKKVSNILLVVDTPKGTQQKQASAEKTAVAQPEKKDQAVTKTEKPKFKSAPSETRAPRVEKGVQRFFRRKAI